MNSMVRLLIPQPDAIFFAVEEFGMLGGRCWPRNHGPWERAGEAPACAGVGSERPRHARNADGTGRNSEALPERGETATGRNSEALPDLEETTKRCKGRMKQRSAVKAGGNSEALSGMEETAKRCADVGVLFCRVMGENGLLGEIATSKIDVPPYLGPPIVL